jgi:hypothetical protein
MLRRGVNARLGTNSAPTCCYKAVAGRPLQGEVRQVQVRG